MSISASRRDQFRAIEIESSKRWSDKKLFEQDAPMEEPKDSKYLITFPYPYMNGVLHLGHAFSLSKAEFAAGYLKMLGKRVLWPFGFHATGMPIAACARKLADEIREFGNPPVFPDSVEALKTENANPDAKTFHSKKGKKAPTSKRQWEIMKQMKVEDIEKFQDPQHWLNVFPNIALQDLKYFGCRIDYRRSFVTTDLNPYYDSFIRWQFQLLKERKKVAFGKRYSIFSPLDNQPCQDHDRLSGEGVLPLEYTIVKIYVQEPSIQPALNAHSNVIAGKQVVLPAATLRPETMVGQTNCWISPKIMYGAYDVNGEIFIMTKRSARNLSFQDHSVSEMKFEISGSQLVGLKLSAPYSPFSTVFALPMDTINDQKGTGIVTSVPSDSPDDFINFRQLKESQEVREKLKVEIEWLNGIDVVPVLEVKDSELGTMAAEVACRIHSVKNSKDTEALEAAKKMTYKEGFYQGIMIRGPFEGKRVEEAKVLMRDLMIKENKALAYCEPDGTVISRSGDECVVALTDQWYLKYGEEDWKKIVEKHVEQMETFNPSVRTALQETISWLKEWACSRTFGLGTRMPYENSSQYLIESLSDSTIYMAYYTIAHILHGENNLFGTSSDNPNFVAPEAMTPAVWDYIFLGGSEPQLHSTLTREKLQKMRHEFQYWYPVDLRVSGKDLIQNHLTMALYNHAAVWNEQPELWPRGYFCNGHILIDKEKMSKSLGNFRTMREALDDYSVDGTRLALADSGDSLDDPNFVTTNAVAFSNKLGSLIDFCEDACAKLLKDEHRKGDLSELTMFDMIFENEIHHAIVTAGAAYAKMQFRHAIHAGFFELTNARDEWKVHCGPTGLHPRILQKYIEVQCRILFPICPHVTDYIFVKLLPAYSGKPESLATPGMQWPQEFPVDASLRLVRKLILDALNNIRSSLQKSAKKQPPINTATIIAASGYSEWQIQALRVAHDVFKKSDRFILHENTATLAQHFKTDPILANKIPDALSFLAYVRDNSIEHDMCSLTPAVDDYETLKPLTGKIAELSNIQHVHIKKLIDVTDDMPEAAAAKKSRTAQPSVYLSHTN